MGKIEMNLEKLMNFNINHKHKNILNLKTLDRMIVIVTMQHPFLVKMTHPHANMPEKCPRGVRKNHKICFVFVAWPRWHRQLCLRFSREFVPLLFYRWKRESDLCFFGKISEAMKALRWRNNYTMVQINKCTLAAQHRTSPQAGRQNIHFPGIIQAAEDALLYVITKTYSAIPN